MSARLAFVWLILLISGLFVLSAVEAQAPSISLDTPKPGQMVSYRVMASGSVSDSNSKVWILVRELGTRKPTYWVQPRPRIRNGKWSGVIYVGRSTRDIGKNFEIIALMDPRGSMPEGRSISEVPSSRARRSVTVKRGNAP